ncbi:MFS transporter, partial [Klebsiella pneumoniae]
VLISWSDKALAPGFTLISVFTLSGPGPLSLLRRQVNEVA